MVKDSESEEALAALETAWEKEKRPLQTKARWGGYNDPTKGDEFRLSFAGLCFAILAIAFPLTRRGDSIFETALFVLGFAGVSYTFFWLSADVRRRLRKFIVAKARYEEARKKITSRTIR